MTPPIRAHSGRVLRVPGWTEIVAGGAVWRIGARPVSRPPAGWRRLCNRVYVDADRLTATLPRVRFWRAGDRFQPLGLIGTKKLQDFFVDEKIPPGERRGLPLVVNRAGILWLAGHRLGSAAKITPQTRRIMELTVERHSQKKRGRP